MVDKPRHQTPQSERARQISCAVGVFQVGYVGCCVHHRALQIGNRIDVLPGRYQGLGERCFSGTSSCRCVRACVCSLIVPPRTRPLRFHVSHHTPLLGDALLRARKSRNQPYARLTKLVIPPHPRSSIVKTSCTPDRATPTVGRYTHDHATTPLGHAKKSSTIATVLGLRPICS
jgi:hypothetical protein